MFDIAAITKQLSKSHFTLVGTICNTTYVKTDKIPTAAVDDRGRLFYNEEWMNSLRHSEQCGVILHEIYHIALNHAGRGKRIENCNHHIFNIAADVCINEGIKSYCHDVSLPDKHVDANTLKREFGIKYDSKKHCTEDLYYKLLAVAEEEQRDGGGGDSSDGGGHGNSGGSSSQGGSGQNKDEDENKDGDENKGEGSEIGDDLEKKGEEDFYDKIYEDAFANGDAYDPANKDGSKGASGASDELREIDLPEIMEEDEVAEFSIASFIKNSTDSTRKRSYKRPNKRYREIYPITKGKVRVKDKPRILFSIDVSPSMSPGDIARAVDVVERVIRKYPNISTDYNLFTSRIDQSGTFTGGASEIRKIIAKAKVGMGTNSHAAFNNFDLRGKNLILISDMEMADLETCAMECKEQNCNLLVFEVNNDGITYVHKDLESFI